MAAKLLAAQQEKDRKERDDKLKREAKLREADKENRRNVHKGILSVLVKNGISEEDGKTVIKLAAKGLLPKLIINY